MKVQHSFILKTEEGEIFVYCTEKGYCYAQEESSKKPKRISEEQYVNFMAAKYDW